MWKMLSSLRLPLAMILAAYFVALPLAGVGPRNGAYFLGLALTILIGIAIAADEGCRKREAARKFLRTRGRNKTLWGRDFGAGVSRYGPEEPDRSVLNN